MPRFYFHLTSLTSRISDESGNQIIYHVGADDASEWKVIISNDKRDALVIIPFPKAIDDWSSSWQCIDGKGVPSPTKSGA
jgi:hypothetical protein